MWLEVRDRASMFQPASLERRNIGTCGIQDTSRSARNIQTRSITRSLVVCRNKFPTAPDPTWWRVREGHILTRVRYYLNFTQKYFRDAAPRHLRMEQFNLYLYMAGENDTAVPYTAEDTVAEVDEDAPPVDIHHRNCDEFMEATKISAHFLSNARHVPGCKRRAPARLGVSRVPFIEPIGASRENFYESKLALGLAWFCEEMPSVVQDDEGNSVTEWTFRFNPPEAVDGRQLEPVMLKLGLESVSFEVVCNQLERRFCDAELNLVCRCCAEEMRDSVCKSCRHAIGFHLCRNPNNPRPQLFLWRKGTLHAGVLDVQRVLFNLHRKLLPTNVLQEKASEYLAADLISSEMAARVVECIKQERGTSTYLNDGVEEVPEDAGGAQTLPPNSRWPR